MHTTSAKEPGAGRALSRQANAVKEIQRAIAHGYRRILVIGPKGSRRLASVRAALAPLEIKLGVIDLEGVGSTHDLDRAARKAGLGRDFQGATAQLERRARGHRVAFAFHNFGECSCLRDDDRVVFAVWLGAKYHCQSSIMVFTTTNPEFMSRCFERFKECRTFVYRVELAGRSRSRASSRGHKEGKSP
jgi:hypothetical protein